MKGRPRLRVRIFSIYANIDMRLSAFIGSVEQRWLTEDEQEVVSDVRTRIYNAWAAKQNADQGGAP